MAKKPKPAAQRGATGTRVSSRTEMIRQQQEAHAKKQRTLRIWLAVAAVVGLALVITVVAVGIQHARQREHDENTTGDATSQITPNSASTDGLGVRLFADQTQADAPEVDVAFDYQCSGCASSDQTYGETLESLASQGLISLRYRVLSFMDTNMSNDSSTRAAIAATCADQVGYFPQYSAVVFSNYTGSTDGYTDDQLSNTFAASAGITGDDLTSFQACYSAKQTSDFVKAMNTANLDAGITGTPKHFVNGNEFDISAVTDVNEESLLSAIQAAA